MRWRTWWRDNIIVKCECWAHRMKFWHHNINEFWRCVALFKRFFIILNILCVSEIVPFGQDGWSSAVLAPHFSVRVWLRYCLQNRVRYLEENLLFQKLTTQNYIRLSPSSSPLVFSWYFLFLKFFWKENLLKICMYMKIYDWIVN